MAIARIKASPDWFRRTAAETKDVPRLARELTRAWRPERRRPTLIAELDADEVRELARRLPDDEYAVRALRELEAAEEHERADRRRIQAIVTARHPKDD